MATAEHEADPPPAPDHVAAAIVARASAGDQDAWRLLVDRYARRVYALVRARVGDAHIAEEVTQSVFVTIAEHLDAGRYREEGRFEAWLFRLAMNRLRDERRASKRRDAMLRRADAEFGSRRATGEDRAHDGAANAGPGVEALRRALALLGDADREVIELRHHAGLEFRAIAAALGEPLGTVLARHHRALRKLRAILDKGEHQKD